MKKVRKITFVTLLFVFVVIQLFQPALNVKENQESSTGFLQMYNMPSEVEAMFLISCYDCHSDHTNYQWYDYIQPGRWLVEGHIEKAKTYLNFNEWDTYSVRKQERLLRSMAVQIETGKMPLSSYTLIHRDAVLRKTQIDVLSKWLKEQI